MTPEQSAAIGRATRALKLQSLFLYEARFERPIAPPGDSAQVLRQDKCGVVFAVGVGPETERQLEVRVSLGLRIAENERQDAKIFLTIEADFIVVYQLEGEPGEDALKAFAEFNAVHNVWPFWRQHVHDIVKRGNLPDLVIPLYSGVND